MTIPKDILAYNAAQPASDAATCRLLAATIDQHLKNAECRIWHRHPVWFLDGNPIVGYHHLKGTKKSGPCTRLLFWSGQSFNEPALPADPPGTKFKSAAARFTSVDDVPVKDLKRWLRKSAEIQWDYKNIVKRKGKLVLLSPKP
ncbi:MAG: DUF1801 domain-containing protein [Phycisphaerales bacterium]